MQLKYDWKITGHKVRIADLEKEILEQRLAHAYLFAGPEQIGKYTVAKTMAAIIQCPNDYCHECATCKEIEKGYHADTIEANNNEESIKIEDAREMLAKLNLSRSSKRKILLIKNLERMTIEAANAMLKMLEDPPDGVLFLLTTSREKAILPTIISRVRLYSFQRLPDKLILDLLRSLYPLMDPDLLAQIASFALGRPGRAVKFIQEPELFEEAKKLYNDVSAFVKNPDRLAEFAYAERVANLVKERESDMPLRDFLDTLTAVGRAKMLEAEGSERLKAVKLMREVRMAYDLAKNNVNTRLLLENLFLRL